MYEQNPGGSHIWMGETIGNDEWSWRKCVVRAEVGMAAVNPSIEALRSRTRDAGYGLWVHVRVANPHTE